MITIFTIPKAFEGQTGIHQRNAIGSWLALPCEKQVILVGNDPGVAEAAQEMGCDHIPNVTLSSLGTPFLDDAFALASQKSKYARMCYCNADIIFPPDFSTSIKILPAKNFLAIGRRHELALNEAVDFRAINWWDGLEKNRKENGELAPPHALDYFVFTNGIAGEIPPFIVGRPGWDNWMVGNALLKKFKVIDCSGSITAIHQKHGYEHVPKKKGDKWQGPEGDHNLRLLGKMPLSSTEYATHALANGKINSRNDFGAIGVRSEWLWHTSKFLPIRFRILNRFRAWIVARLFRKTENRIDFPLFRRFLYYLSASPRWRNDI